MTDNDRYRMVQLIIGRTMEEMTLGDMMDFIGDRLENDFDRWSEKSLVSHFQTCCPEDFKIFEFEQVS